MRKQGQILNFSKNRKQIKLAPLILKYKIDK